MSHGDFIWYSELKFKPIFLDKRELYIQLHRSDTNDCQFVCTNHYIGTLKYRFWCSSITRSTFCPRNNINRIAIFQSWFFIYPVQDFYQFIQ